MKMNENRKKKKSEDVDIYPNMILFTSRWPKVERHHSYLQTHNPMFILCSFTLIIVNNNQL